HDGKVTEADLALLLKIQAEIDTFKQDYKDGSNHYSGVTNEVASDVNFDGTVDLKDVELINAYLDGTYNLGDPVPEQKEPEKDTTLYGDISGDGAINLADVIYINKAIAGSYIIPESLKPSADVCKDGEINLDDTLVLLKYLINLVKLPVIPE
ncbi:MAG: hypothetical protein IJZ64_00760, partial [Ruminococcus sp.]|nr:hypothetical protein [Ruminococcus sp.]